MSTFLFIIFLILTIYYRDNSFSLITALISFVCLFCSFAKISSFKSTASEEEIVTTNPNSSEEAAQDLDTEKNDTWISFVNQNIANDMRIIDESLTIMTRTSNIDTFLSRYDVAMEFALKLEQAKKAGVPITLPDDFSQSLANVKKEALAGVLYRSFDKELDEIKQLKTKRGMLNRIDMYQDQLKKMYEYEHEFVEKDTYNDMMYKIESLRNNILRSSNAPSPAEDPYAIPKCIDDLKERHYKVLRRLHKHPEGKEFSGRIALEVDIPKFIPVAQKLGLIELTRYPDSLYYLKNDVLKQFLKNQGLKVSGKKQELIDRIVSNIDQITVQNSTDYSNFYILTEKGRSLNEESYARFQYEKTEFLKNAVTLILDIQFKDAYRIICKRNAEEYLSPSIARDWERRYYSEQAPYIKCYKQQLFISNNKLITAAAIYAYMSGDGLRDVSFHLKDAFFLKGNVAESLLYAHSLLHSEIEFDSYQECGVEKYEFVATLDKNTCPICGELDGKTFSVSEKRIGINCPPMHVGCRCFTEAVNDTLINCTQRRAKSPITNKSELIPYITYSEWIKQFK